MTGDDDFLVQKPHFLTNMGEQNHCSEQWSVEIALAAQTVYDWCATILNHVRTSAGEQEYEHS